MAEFTDVTRRSLLAATAGLAISGAGCLGGDDPKRPGEIDPDRIDPGGELTVGFPGELDALNPLTASSGPTNALLDLLYQPGVLVDPATFEARPWVFTDWTARETAEGMAIDLSVREDLRWSDGEDLTVEDVLFTYELYANRTPGRTFGATEPIDSVEAARGEYDLTLSLDRVVGTYETDQLSLRLLPEHVWSGIDDYAAHDPEVPVALGPGRLLEQESPTERVVSLGRRWPLATQPWVEDHDLLLAGGPYLASIRVRLFAGPDAVHRALLNGEIDAMYAGAFEAAQASGIVDREGLGLIAGRSDGYGHYTLNMRRPPLDDQAFRQALSMAMDRGRWVRELALEYAVPGNAVVPPAFESIRPEAAADEPIQQRPDGTAPDAMRALGFRGADGGGLDIRTVRSFLENGAVVSGSAGTYAGREYPGSLTGFGETAQTEAAYEYAFDEVSSELLAQADVDAELYVDGQPLGELHGGPLVVLSPPADERPLVAEFTRGYVEALRRVGIPIETTVRPTDAIADRAYLETDFDVYAGEWSDLSSAGVPSLYEHFHSDNAHADGSGSTVAYNAAGYGLDGLAGADEAIATARREPDRERRNELVREITERIYLEAPTLVRSYPLEQWPVDTEQFAGFLPSIPGVGSSNLWLQSLTVHRR
ncbi:ABC transporter substrate-binding protein [Halalkalicoccus jeotgali]|uniref:Extracellular solute-binding protein family 5 n=1 Tax=Halalkalicoccus jeotgali (strain DSM 18796 / CECT 7217 / JCM 14584 / KCTC 4019 / B3) TaxID=795797 RepID=D8J3T0_HALJB|nr:ABC transporter substrate-binding protein [Halalkalicoccus jeotgali]ADJ13421.1 extracellular solute-binding protein family 5 [Halalkalicoccus jeotgali B3]ELY32747.1 family 5 extracellular solute-binding protein [Halalkalicoccus jeotgali B3]